ncbi:MAG: hypothetical protein AB1721_00315 [Patescibacteria group bacterium]
MINQEKSKQLLFEIAGIAFLIAIGLSWYLNPNKPATNQKNQASLPAVQSDDYFAEVLPASVVLPIEWRDFGKQMVEKGVIDKEKFESIYTNRGGLTEEMRQLLEGENNGQIVMTEENSGYLLNLFWAFGLANKNFILEIGPMQQYGNPANFASTGGWTIAVGGPMKHYSQYEFVSLTPEQQDLVERISQNIYRPCCNNPTSFPDCNHGMAMLGLLELLAKQGLSEQEIYSIALKVNSYWFPDTYLTLAKYFQEKQNLSWEQVKPKEVLGIKYSSGSGYQKVLSEIQPPEYNSGGSCGV